MDRDPREGLKYVEAVLNYLVDTGEKPVIDLYPPPHRASPSGRGATPRLRCLFVMLTIGTHSEDEEDLMPEERRKLIRHEDQMRCLAALLHTALHSVRKHQIGDQERHYTSVK